MYLPSRLKVMSDMLAMISEKNDLFACNNKLAVPTAAQPTHNGARQGTPKQHPQHERGSKEHCTCDSCSSNAFEWRSHSAALRMSASLMHPLLLL